MNSMPAFLRTMAVFIGLISTGYGAVAREADYVCHLLPQERLGVIPITVPTPQSAGKYSIYVAPQRAIVVTGLTVDGASLLNKRAQSILHLEGPETILVDSGSYTYLINVAEGMTFVPEERQSFDGNYFATIRFPKKWSKIEIRYKIRFPHGVISPELALHVYRLVE